MSKHQVDLVANEGIFRGLSKQNMLFHQCIGELVDNGIAASDASKKFKIDIIFISNNEDNSKVDIYVADNSKGMNLEVLKKALQLGESATTENRLNEHGFGLKNALATLSGGNGYWKIWTHVNNESNVCSVEGPFGTRMVIDDEDTFPQDDFLPIDISTLIKVPVKLSFIQTVQGRGAPASDLGTLRTWLIEHLGIMYRGYLELDEATGDNSGIVNVVIGNDSIRVPPIKVPLGKMKTEYIDVELGGSVNKIEYRYGTLDEVKRDTLVRGEKAKYYYQGNIPTQGIDIRLGKRVIATKQFETIWKTKRGDTQLSRHNRFNEFVGELLIPDLTRGILTTTNNKTDFNLDDQNWQKIFDKLNLLPPEENIREKSETALRKKWIEMLKATSPEDEVADNYAVWPTATKIDVFRKTSDGKIIIYELKVGSGSPIHLYQLKMYWDGLIIQNVQPKEGILLVEDFNTNLEEMANLMNQLTPPNKTKPYNFKIEKLKDKGL